MSGPASLSASDPALWELARREYRRELLEHCGQELLTLLDKAAAGELPHEKLTDWEAAVIGLALCFTTATLMLPDRPYPALDPAIN